jgi:alpha-L-rhamnosidase
VPADKAQYDALAKYIASRGMACSVYCSGFLLQALYNAGHGQDALNLLTSSGTNSWLHMIQLGAGATGEAWDPAQKSNMTWSHPWATAPAYVIPRDMYGIKPTSPGYATFQITPQTGDQEFGSVTVPSVKGRIGVVFHTVSGRYDLGVAIPGNTTSAVSVPVPGTYSGTTVYLDGRPVTGTRADDRVVVQVGAGCHTLSTSDSAQVGADKKLTDICHTSS